jgi:hypothetical protein
VKPRAAALFLTVAVAGSWLVIIGAVKFLIALAG